jgi:hypothetical protein
MKYPVEVGARRSDPLGGARPGSPQVWGDTLVVPRLKVTDGGGAGPSYVAMREALAGGWLEVAEVSAGGSVPELRVVNLGTQRVLIIDGEELLGAKQNRVLNTSILVDRKSELIVPVSCTEAGRWHHVSASFADSGVVAERGVRQTLCMSVQASVEAGCGHRSDQGAVWAEVDGLQRRHAAPSRTSAMRDVFTSRAETLERALAAMPLVAGQVGIAVLRHGDVIGLDYVSRPTAYAQVHDKLLRSYLLDASPAQGRAGAAELVLELLAAVRSLEPTPFPSPGLGLDMRYRAPGLVGSALLFRGRTIHAAFFVVDEWRKRQGGGQAGQGDAQSGSGRSRRSLSEGRMSAHSTRAGYRRS